MKKTIAKLLVATTLLFSVNLTNIGPVFAETQTEQLENAKTETLLIPDQYNTGCDESLCTSWSTDNDPFIKAGGVYRDSTAGKILSIDFNKATTLKNLTTDTIVYENIDFTAFPCFEFMNSGSTIAKDNCSNGYDKIKFKFVNCIIPCIWGHNVSETVQNYDIEIEKCTIYRFTGSYASVNGCRFGGANWWQKNHKEIFKQFISDGSINGDMLNPGSNCTFKNCYIYDGLYSTETQESAHIDGIQTQNIHDLTMINCRFELPQMNFTASQGDYNAAIFLQGIITNGTFKNIIVNGAAKAIQSTSTVHVNTNFENVKYGLDSQYISLTKQFDPSSDNYAGPICDGTNDISEQTVLYVTSTIKDKDEIKIVTTNDTGADRKLKVVTNVGQEIYTIPSIKNGDELELDATWKETNVDYIVSLNATDVTSVRCFDVTDEENEVEVCYSEQFVEMNIPENSDNDVTYSLGERDKLVIPDKYNTGLSDESLCIDTLSEPNAANRRFAGNNTDLAFKNSSAASCHGEGSVNLAVVVNEKDEYIIENVDFETYDITFTTSVSGTVIFRNCKLNQVTTGSKVIFENCDIQGMLKCGDVEVKSCKIHNTTGDALFPVANTDTIYTFKVSDTYIYDLCNENSAIGDHIDGIQITGTGSAGSSDLLPKIEMNNVRFSLPMFQKYVDDDTGTGKVNGCIFVQGYRGTLAEGNLFNNIIIDSSNTTNPIFVSGGTDENSNIFNNVKISNQWDSPFRNSENIYYTANDCVLNNNLYVSSVYEKDGKYNIVVTNNNNTNKILKVKTNKGIEEFDIDLSPTTNELMNDSTYSNYSFDDMTYDRIIEVDSTGVEYIVCYDGDKQIRFIDFTEDKKYTNSNTENEPEHTHSYKDEVTVPTCTQQGYTTHTCECGDSYVDSYTNALGHQHTEIRNAVAATCTTEGYTGDVYCTDCDSVVTHGQTVSKTAHTYVYGICQFCKDIKESSQEGLKYTVIVTEDGTHKVSVKANEDTNLSDNIVIPSTITIDGETYTVTEIEDGAFKGTDIKSIVIPDTIEKIGSNAFENCENLKHIEFKGTTAPVFESDSLNGMAEDITLVVPDDAQGYNNQVIIAKVEHIYNAQVQHPDCTHRGYTKYSCILCSDEKVSDYVDALGHSYGNGIVTKIPTCKDFGTKVYKCTKCDNTYEETIAKDASNHGNNTEVRNKKDATCTAEGYTGDTYCKDCNTLLHNGTTIPKVSHNYTSVVTESTCTEGGYTTYTCSECHESYRANETATKGHTPGTPVQENVSGPATFESDMTCDTVTRCTVCNAETSRTSTILVYRIASVEMVNPIIVYTGKALKPAVVAKDSQGNVIPSSNYTVAYKNNKKMGKATAIVTFKGNYSGSKKLTFTIGPKGTTLAKAKAGKKSLSVTWKKQTKNTTGYEIQYSTDKNFKKGVKTVTISKNKTTSTTIKKLTSKKTYYVRIRSFKKSGKTKYYSDWSKVKNVKVK